MRIDKSWKPLPFTWPLPHAMQWDKIHIQGRALIFNHIVVLLPLLPSCGRSGLSHEDAWEAGGAVVLARGDSWTSAGTHRVDKSNCHLRGNQWNSVLCCNPRPLPEEMLSYARDDTHYLLYIYDKMRLELWERGNEQPTQLQVVWQRSRDICLKVQPGPRFHSGPRALLCSFIYF